MEPGFHLRYAGRLAWRYRLLFALGLALLGLLHPGFALASPLALLLPARLFARRALREISRVSLAYATALAYGEERLWAEARRVRLELPPFPLGLLLAYLLALLLALALPAWRPGAGGGVWSPPGVERPQGEPASEGVTPSPGREGAAPPQRGQGGDTNRVDAPAEGTGQGVSPASPGQEGRGVGEGGASREQEGPSPSPGGRGVSGGRESGESPGQEGGPSPAQGQKGETQPGLGGPATELGEAPQVLPPALEGPGQGLLEPGGEGGEGALPSPWPGGRPPERVRRGAEVYLERTPLPPEARELIRRYFGGP